MGQSLLTLCESSVDLTSVCTEAVEGGYKALSPFLASLKPRLSVLEFVSAFFLQNCETKSGTESQGLRLFLSLRGTYMSESLRYSNPYKDEPNFFPGLVVSCFFPIQYATKCWMSFISRG